jgi:hypothetical protein
MKAGSRSPGRAESSSRGSCVISLDEYRCGRSTPASRLQVPIGGGQGSVQRHSPLQSRPSVARSQVLDAPGASNNRRSWDHHRQKGARIRESKALLAAILVACCLAVALGL